MTSRPASSAVSRSPGPDPHTRTGGWRVAVYALAQAGGVLSYLPLLGLVLPIKVASLAGAARFDVLTAAVIAGALAASGSNLAFGWLSDRDLARGRGRRRGLAAGLAATLGSYALVAAADGVVPLIGAVVLFQIAANALLAPLFALMADEIDDRHKGHAGAWLTLGIPFASAVSTASVGLTGAAAGMTLAIAGAALVACILPLLLARPRAGATAVAIEREPARRHDLAVAWVARLLVQVAGNVLFLYLLYYFATLDREASLAALAPRIASVQTLAFALPVPVALLLGIASDRLDRRKPFLFGSAVIAAAGTALMARASGWAGGVGGFTLYAVGVAVFLALNATFAMQLTGGPARRGRDLGLVNLANTLPALVGPALTWSLATPRDFTPALWALTALTAAGGVLTLFVRSKR